MAGAAGEPRRGWRRARRWLGSIALAAAVALLVLAPSWRSYYLPRRGLTIVEDLAYVEGSSDPRHRLDYYLPGPPAATGWPVVVFVHGGLWRPHHRRLAQPFTGLYGGVGVALARQGIGTAVIDFRQHPEATSLDEPLADVARAVRFVQRDVAARGGDPRRLYLVGFSAGATLTAELALAPAPLVAAGVDPSSVRAFASLAGVYDQERAFRSLGADLEERARALAGPGDGLARHSPERLLHPGHPPLLALVGDDDTPALVEEHRAFARALARAGGDATTVEIPGEDHMDLVMHLHRPGDRTLAELLRFLDRHR